MRRVASAIALWMVSGCTGPSSALRPFDGTWNVCRGTAAPIELTYLGAGGFVMRRGRHAIMTAPFYSNPGLVQTGLGLPIHANVERIDRSLPPVGDVEAILVGHSHYDHLMDAVRVAERWAPNATLYGNDTMVNLLAARPALWDRIRSVERDAGDWTRPGAWHTVGDGSIRFMALRSEHAPHFLGIELFQGDVREVQRTLPRNAYGWRKGQTLAFVIEFLTNGKVDFRIHYQDAGSNPPAGLPPLEECRTPFDVDILCVASFEQVRGYPEAILARTRPKLVLLGHWENFFHRPEPRPGPVPFTDTERFAERLTAVLPATPWAAPRPGAVVQACP